MTPVLLITVETWHGPSNTGMMINHCKLSSQCHTAIESAELSKEVPGTVPRSFQCAAIMFSLCLHSPGTPPTDQKHTHLGGLDALNSPLVCVCV